jgi:hypothetical protein
VPNSKGEPEPSRADVTLSTGAHRLREGSAAFDPPFDSAQSPPGLASLGRCGPLFGDEQLRLCCWQIEHVADRDIRETDVVDAVCELPCEPNAHAVFCQQSRGRAISTARRVRSNTRISCRSAAQPMRIN